MATQEAAPPSAPGGIRGFADRRPFRHKLNALVGVPLAVVAILLAYLITDQIGQSSDAADAARLVRNSSEVAILVDRLEAEHQQAILLSVRHEATNDGGTPSQSPYRDAQVATDTQVEKVRKAFGAGLPDGEAQALKDIEGLESLRNTVEQAYLPADNIDPAYTSAAKALIDGLGLDRNPALAATFTGNLLDSLLRADAAHSSFETGVFSATTGDSNALIEFIGAVGSHDEYLHQADRFARFATEAQAEQLSGIQHNSAQAVIDRQYALLQIDPSSLQADSPAEVKAAFKSALDSYGSYRKQASIRLGIATTLIDQIADRADQASDDSLHNAVLLLGLALFGFVLWLAFSVAVRRSVVRPVQALTGAARQVAGVADRELARVADDDAEDDGPVRLGTVPVTAPDEIGELAEAFNHVQATAVALLERQVLSRRNTAEMFGNVGRRVSNLTSRQLALIDAVERGETDPELLERLYSIDHIAVRLRRNADSLMLLAGIRESVLAAGPTALTNVVRAALGQIEGFQRVQLLARTEILVEPDVIGDLTLMVAELVENAVSFSPADSPVEVFVQNTADGAAIVIADHGLGMDPERLDEENARIVRRERLDLVPTKVLGLFVVGTLSRRWGIDVALSRTPGGGVTAEVALPPELLLAKAAVAPAPTTPATEADDSGPRPSETDPLPDDEHSPLPRRVRRPEATDTPAAEEPATAAPSDTAGAPAEAGTAAPAAPAADATAEAAASASDPATEGAPATDGSSDEAVTPATADAPVTSAASGSHDAPPASQASSSSSDGLPYIPQARTEEPPPPGGTSGTARPLRRRVRGATLRNNAEAGPHGARQAPRPADADAVRAALEEFEAAVERAHRDSVEEAAVATTSPVTPHEQDQNHLPEGAEQ
ncbi:ATP-binding protein [Streptomyces sp. S.PB5]|uniref:ATP-binding protein n=1 Tax=Streptomyces sp. S.PB5 TaxID=3020844 RepID=UPI0025B14D2B|nr:ATP-binding protein [Streptomyces sp. S.PB5]MDN3021640.1 HAMP domain-containing protein [Streptomyces sp. S.PB5]